MTFGFAIVFCGILFTEHGYATENVSHGDIAIIDLKKIASETTVGKDIEKQIASFNNESKKDFLDLESKIKSMDSNKKSDSDARKIEDMQLILYDMVRQKRFQISEAYKTAIASLDREIKKIVKEICRKRGIKMVIASDAVAYNDDTKSTDISDEVIVLVNKSCPSIKVKLKE
ncbi:MAG: OmpH family outer membrane protein [Holosporaceae bacterium]|jgi:Skp family chaperone for outer membrane proteins|nr:OmpH family outer membrane protein [Holosporaceae bacterium]